MPKPLARRRRGALVLADPVVWERQLVGPIRKAGSLRNAALERRPMLMIVGTQGDYFHLARGIEADHRAGQEAAISRARSADRAYGEAATTTTCSP
jgi:hypothetical protein